MQSPIRIPLEYATPPPGPALDRGRAAIGWMFVAMLLGGLACPFLAVLLFDVGRGSAWAVRTSSVAGVVSPLACVAWAMRHRTDGKWLARVLLAVAVVADAFLLGVARRDAEYFRLAWRSSPSALAAWATLWLLWQAVALAAARHPRKPPPS